MLKTLMATGVLAAAAVAGAAQAAPSLEIRDAAARVTIVPEARSDIDVQVLRTNDRVRLTVGREGERTVIDGHIARLGSLNCNRGDGDMGATVNLMRIAPEDMPRIVVRVPRDAEVRIHRGAIQGAVGPSHSLRLVVGGCGEWAVANVEERLSIVNAGSSRIRTGSAGQAELTMAGSGQILSTDVAGPVEARLPGSGRIRLASAGGGEFQIAGSGDIEVAQVRGPMEASIAGSGDITAGRVAGPLEARIAGSGNIRVREGEASRLEAHIMGSGGVAFGGVAQDLDVTIMGSGGVHVGRVSGNSRQTIRGSGRVSIGS